ncbi:hypothetical protein AKJ49_00685 [candidate division MSBL1 archaeon SCGC-AAA382A03]|uniref:Putative 3-methyladenine DNA glycosylase n=1 Tax=candidate division MSBL1 archaeon SCGC-AAA382A03 TaxID=1698278 RepID=A0A133VG95_9EURY|nr:hypothetical protein AKJ49_00685 [candidate division MSBL1 archaeon SCGC-AAA382A03]
MKMNLSRNFYERDPANVAQELLGKVLIHSENKKILKGKIVETEAYYGIDDPASRASNKKTKINKIMWEKAGTILVYMVHGNWLFNVTTQPKNTPGAVLIRATEPLDGIKTMKKRREKEKITELSSGPGKLTQAFGINSEYHGTDLITSEKIFISNTEKEEKFDIETSHRIGVTKDLDRELRFFISNNKHVS